MTHVIKGHSMPPINPTKGFRIHLLVFLLTIPAIWLVWYLTDTTYVWPLWHTLSWLSGILFHYLGVYVFPSSKTPQ